MIIGHSYGGLVALYALASGSPKQSNVQKIKRIIVIASPYYGSSFAMFGLAGSPHFLKLIKPFIPIAERWGFDRLFDRAYPILLRRMLPIFSAFQSLYDMIPHDSDMATPDCVRYLYVPGSSLPRSSEYWGYWGYWGEGAPAHLEMKAAGRQAQLVLRRPISVDVASIFGSALQTPHFFRVSSGPKYLLEYESDLPGDGVVAACCTYRAPNHRRLELTPESEPKGNNFYLTHNGIIHHGQTHAWLDELLA